MFLSKTLTGNLDTKSRCQNFLQEWIRYLNVFYRILLYLTLTNTDKFSHSLVNISLVFVEELLLFVMVINIFSEVLVLFDHTRARVAEDGAHDGREAADLDSGQHSDGSSDAHSHQSSNHWETSHWDGRIIMIAVFILKQSCSLRHKRKL